MYKLKIIIASTRQGRKGPAVAEWISERAKENSIFDVEVLDLAAINLPLFDEPNHPRLQQYVYQHTRDWSAKIEDGDAFIIVTPEYNFGFPASIKNALDYLAQEWANKPVGLVGYGGISAGTRALQMLKPVLVALKLMPVADVTIPFFTQHIDKTGKFVPSEAAEKSASGMMKELGKWSRILKEVRNDK